MATHRQQAKAARYAGWTTRVALVVVLAVAVVAVLFAPPRQALGQTLASPAERPAAAIYQATLSVGTGAQYDVLQGASLTLPITVTVTGAVKLAAATVLVQYDPLDLLPVACVRQSGAPDGYCNVAWDTTKGLVRFSILSAEGVALDTDVGLFTLTFKPAPTATLRRVTSITPLLESIADVQGNYMTSWLQGSTARVMSPTAIGTAVYVGGPSSPNLISITRGTTVTVPIVITGVTGVGLGSATFSLAFNSAYVRPLECRPVQLANASGTCALHADHVSAAVLSASGLVGTIAAFEVVFTTAPTAIAGDTSLLNLTLGAFADTDNVPITVRLFNNALKVTKAASAIVPVLRMTPTSQYLLDDQRVTVQIYLDNGAALAAGTWGIRYDTTIVEAETCQLSAALAGGFCNATGQAGLVRLAVLSTAGGPPSNIGTITFRRHPQAKALQRTSLTFEVTNFTNVTDDELSYQTQTAAITIQDALGSGPAVAMNLVGVPPYPLPQGSSLDFPMHFQIDPARPIVNLSGSIHYDPAVLRPTQCLRYDQEAGPSGYCNAEFDRQNGIIRFNLLAETGITGSLTPFVFRVEAASTSKSGDNSPLHFTVEAIAGPDGVPRTWSATDESVAIKTPIIAPRVLVGPPELLTTAIYTVTFGYTETVPLWVEAVPDLGAGTVEVRYNPTVTRATGCTLRPDLASALDGGFCSLLPGVVRFAFVASQGITGTTHLSDIEFAQAPNVVGGETTPLIIVVDNFVDIREVPIPTSVRNGQSSICPTLLSVTDLRIARSSSDLLLNWTRVAATAHYYQVWRSETAPYFAFGDNAAARIYEVVAPTATTGLELIDAGAGASGANYYYMVRALCTTAHGTPVSNRVGKFVFPLVPGSP